VGLSLASAHRWIVEELARRRPVEQGMFDLIDRCEAARPHPDWATLRALPFADLAALGDWLARPFRDEPHPRPLRGLWFGLFNPCYDGGAPVADLYVCGSERFNPDPGDNGWAVRPAWWPDARYARSAVLAEIYRVAHRKGGLANEAEYPLCLGYAALAVRALLAEVEPALILGPSSALGVAVGFDSGDFVPLGEFGPTGWPAVGL
jgi:hypothetical protein